MLGAIEGGGTKFICGVGDAGGSIETISIPTRDPAATFADVATFFAAAARHGTLDAIGLATFGPMALDPASPKFGTILRTPKDAWRGADLIAYVRGIADVPIGLDTDVNAAACAEAAAADIPDTVYVTVGTGIGAGIVTRGQPVHGASHSELGHLKLRHHPDHAFFEGTCPFHGNCLEGLASGPAMKAAWGKTADQLPDDHPAWAIEADYLAQLCMTLILTVAPRRIVLGGGVMQRETLLPAVRTRTLALLNGYVADLDDEDAMAQRIVKPLCVEPPGLVGAYLLAAGALAAAKA